MTAAPPYEASVHHEQEEHGQMHSNEKQQPHKLEDREIYFHKSNPPNVIGKSTILLNYSILHSEESDQKTDKQKFSCLYNIYKSTLSTFHLKMATGEYEYGSLIKEEVESVGDENDTNSDEKCGALEIGILKNEFEPEFIKLEDIDMVHNLKSEGCLEELKKELPCEVCGGATDSVESSSKCQCQNESNAMQDEDMSWDFKPISFGSDSGNFLFNTQEETVVEQNMLPETNEIFSSGYYLNSTEGSIIHEKKEMCSKNLNGRSDIEDRSTKKTLFYCKVCTKSFTQSYHFKRHEKIHTGERPFQCKLCPKSFIEGGELKIHEKIHTGEKSFHCDICLKSFIRRSHLKQHQKLHTGEKPFQCKICPQSFFQRGDFKRHEKIHTGEKSFQCEICSKSFAQKRYLKIHEKIHTEEKT